MPIIEVKDLSFNYKGQPDYALKNINMTIRQGDFLVLLGPNGSGKTTLPSALRGF